MAKIGDKVRVSPKYDRDNWHFQGSKGEVISNRDGLYQVRIERVIYLSDDEMEVISADSQ